MQRRSRVRLKVALWCAVLDVADVLVDAFGVVVEWCVPMIEKIERFVLKPTIAGWIVWDNEQHMVVDDGPDDEAEEMAHLTRAMNSLNYRLNRV